MNERPTEKQQNNFPATPGWWLGFSNRPSPCLSVVQYLHSLSEGEADKLSFAYNYFAHGWTKPLVTPLFEAYQAWCQAPESAAEFSRLGPLSSRSTEKSLVNFLLHWRMVLDHLRSAIISSFGEESSQYRAFEECRRHVYDSYLGYRIIELMRNLAMHKERPPIVLKLERHPYHCERCGQDHDNRDVSATLNHAWLRNSKKCKAPLREELEKMDTDFIDMWVIIEQGMHGFEDIIYAVLLSSEEGIAYHERLMNVFGETKSDYPVLVKYWINEKNEDRVLMEPFNAVEWVVKRASISLER